MDGGYFVKPVNSGNNKNNDLGSRINTMYEMEDNQEHHEYEDEYLETEYNDFDDPQAVQENEIKHKFQDLVH